MRPPSLSLACMLALCGAVRAQNSAPQAEHQTTASQTTLDVYTEASSRELYSACDGDSDDRLDLFEACEALDVLGDPQDSAAFQRFDTDRDGYLGWSEFDAIFRTAIDRGATFRVRTCRRFVQHAPELQAAKPASPIEQFLRLNDKNGNGGLDPDELKKVARDLGLPPLPDAQIKMLDLDQSGRLEPIELAPWLDRIRGGVPMPGQPPASSSSPMPAPWTGIDENGDGAVDIGELARALRRIDPALVHWAQLLLAKFDRDKDGRVGADELPKAKSQTASANPTRRRDS